MHEKQLDPGLIPAGATVVGTKTAAYDGRRSVESCKHKADILASARHGFFGELGVEEQFDEPRRLPGHRAESEQPTCR